MKILIIAMILSAAFSVWVFWPCNDGIDSHSYPTQPLFTQSEPPISNQVSNTHEIDRKLFRCDGRQYCSQMGSHEEAKYFLDHCGPVKMDGDGDGIPCERQFGHH